MNRPIAAAATLMAATFFVHVFVGGPETDAPIRASDLPEIARATAHVVWHMVSWMLAVIAAALFWLSRHDNRALEITMCQTTCAVARAISGRSLLRIGASVSGPPTRT